MLHATSPCAVPHLIILHVSCQVLVPVAFFGLMCIPKHYIKPQPLPRQILSQAIDLDMGLASKPGSTDYKGARDILAVAGVLACQELCSSNHNTATWQ